MSVSGKNKLGVGRIQGWGGVTGWDGQGWQGRFNLYLWLFVYKIDIVYTCKGHKIGPKKRRRRRRRVWRTYSNQKNFTICLIKKKVEKTLRTNRSRRMDTTTLGKRPREMDPCLQPHSSRTFTLTPYTTKRVPTSLLPTRPLLWRQEDKLSLRRLKYRQHKTRPFYSTSYLPFPLSSSPPRTDLLCKLQIPLLWPRLTYRVSRVRVRHVYSL